MRRLKGKLLLGALVVLLLSSFSVSASAHNYNVSNVPPGTLEIHPNDPGYIGNSGPYDLMNAPAYWGAILSRSCHTAVAVIDSGPVVTQDQPYGTAANFAPGTGDVPHGTYVASVVGSPINNNLGIAGMSNCPVIGIRAEDPSGQFNSDTIVAALKYAASLPNVRVINMSIWVNAGETLNPKTRAAIQAATDSGKLVVTIAGNGRNENFQGTNDPSANPLAAQAPETLRVGGVDANGQIDYRSNYGAGWVDVGAPFMMSAVAPDGSWSVRAGTSYSAPAVSAIAAEMFDWNPSLNPADVKQRLIDSCKKTGIDVACGGVVDAFAAIQKAGYVPPPPVNVSVALAGAGKGTVTSKPDGINCGTTCSAPFAKGGSVTLDATPSPNSVFVSWQGAGCGSSPTCTFTASSDVRLTATFALRKFVVKVIKKGSGTITSTPAGIACGKKCSAPFAAGSTLKLTAKPLTRGYTVKWSGCTSVTKLGVCTISRLSSAKTLTVNFSKPK